MYNISWVGGIMYDSGSGGSILYGKDFVGTLCMTMAGWGIMHDNGFGGKHYE